MSAPPTLPELQAFIQAAETRNFRLAAERCCISQPALTRRIQSTENKLGVRLMDRNSRHVELTEHGRALLPIARRLVFEFQGALSELSEFIAGIQGNVAVASLPSLGAHFLPLAIARFRQTFPRVKLALKLVDTPALLGLLVAGQVDFALSAPPPAGYDLEFLPLPVEDELMLICACNDALAARACVPWSVICERPYISIGQASSTATLISQALLRHQVQVEPAYEVANIAVLGRMVASGIGVAIVSRLALRLMDGEGLRAVRFQGTRVARSCGVLRLHSRSLSKAASNFLGEIVAAD